MNLAHLIDPHPDDGVAFFSRGRGTSYAELRRNVAGLAGGLARLGVEPGDRVAVIAPNTPFFVTSYLGALAAGAVVVPLNPTSPRVELERQLAITGARVALVAPAGRVAVSAIDRLEVELEHVIAPGSRSGTEPAGGGVPGSEPIEELLALEPAPFVDRDDGDAAVLLFTAGTGGAPKAACLTHGNLRSNLDQVLAGAVAAAQPGDVALGVLPMFHVFGLNAVLNLALRVGVPIVLVERFDAAAALDVVRDHGVTVVVAAPPVYVAWGTQPGIPRDALGSVRLAVSGGAALTPEVAEAFEARFGIPVWEGYGLTEASPIVTSGLVGGQPKRGSIGVPLPGVEVRLVDVEGEDALAGDPGEIHVRGPNVFQGYWNDPDATAAVLDGDGWLRTGDVAVADDDGYLYLVDRAKDLIIVSGFNVYPAEVEGALLEHPDIAEVAVTGVSHPYTGEAVKAFVVPVAGRQLDEHEVIEFCAVRLARYKCPSSVSFVDALPQGLVGKVLRRQLA